MDHKNRQIYTGGKYYFFQPEMSIGDWKMTVMQEDQEIQNLTILSSEKVEYHESTPLYYVLRDQFYMVVNDNRTIAVRNFQVKIFHFTQKGKRVLACVGSESRRRIDRKVFG